MLMVSNKIFLPLHNASDEIYKLHTEMRFRTEVLIMHIMK